MDLSDIDESLLLEGFKPKKRRTVRCPKCKSTNTGKILYGMPDYDEQLNKDLESGKVHLGGCMILGEPPIRRCNNCQNDY